MGPALWFPSLSKVVTKASKVKKAGTKLGLAFCGYYTFTSQVPWVTSNKLFKALLFFTQVADIFLVSGPSMVPTFSEGDIVLAVPTRSFLWVFFLY